MIVLRAMTATGTVLYKAMCAMLSRVNQSSSKNRLIIASLTYFLVVVVLLLLALLFSLLVKLLV